MVKERHSWASVQEWLADLSEEIDAALRDGSLSDLDVDRVWIGNDGRARLLDWSAPDGHKESHSRPRSGAQTVDLAHRRFDMSLGQPPLSAQVLDNFF